uniref:Uncharacterized protein n=1 Tax=Arion vulgaris TaxID=1028688 RepID=A0A0B7B7N3_9EUPU
MRNISKDSEDEFCNSCLFRGKEIHELRYADETVLLSTSQIGIYKLFMTIGDKKEKN